MESPLLIVVTGAPATGKSVLARELASRLHCPLLAKDAIKEPLLDTLGAGDRAWSRKLSDASFAVLFALARELLTSAPRMVLEGNFRPGQHEEPLRDLARGARLLQVLCVAPEAVRRARLAARATEPTRHRGHGDVILADEVNEADRAVGFLDLPGERCTHDGTAGAGARVILAGFSVGEG